MIASWHSADVGDPLRPWYPPEAMTRAGVTVEISTHGGAHLLASVRRHTGSGRLMWMEARPDAPGGWAVLCAWWAPGRRPFPLGRSHPVAWRPQEGVIWPDALGVALAGPMFAASPPVEDSLPERGEPVDGWPIPGVHLGKRAPPESLGECEARLLRAIRAMNTPGVVEMPGVGVRLVDSIRIVTNNALRVEADPGAWIDKSHLPDVRVAWTPEKRDLADWDYALAWTGAATKRGWRIVARRAAMPVWSWRQIADREQVTQARARQIYTATIAAIFERAREARAA